MPRRKTSMTYPNAVQALIIRTDTTFLALVDYRGNRRTVHAGQYIAHLESVAAHARSEAETRGHHAPSVRRDSKIVETGGAWEVTPGLGTGLCSVRPADPPVGPYDVDDDGTVVPPRPAKSEQTDGEWLASMFR